MNRDEHDNQEFCIRIGHWELRIQAASPQEALERARQRLCDEMPRFWDVIHQLHEERFDVRRVA